MLVNGKAIKVGDVLEFPNCRELVKISDELSAAGLRSEMLMEKDGKKGLWLKVTSKTQVSEWLFEDCERYRRLEKELKEIEDCLSERGKAIIKDRLEYVGQRIVRGLLKELEL